MRRHVDGRPISQTNKLRPIGSKHPAKSFSRDLRFHRKRNSIPIFIEFSSSLSAEPWNNFFVKKCATHLIYNGVKRTSERERENTYMSEIGFFRCVPTGWRVCVTVSPVNWGLGRRSVNRCACYLVENCYRVSHTRGGGKKGGRLTCWNQCNVPL